MKKMSLYNRILSYYRRNPDTWIAGGEIERLVVSTTSYKASNASRRLRELCEDGYLERKEVKGSVFYRYLPQKKTIVEYYVAEGNVAKRVEKTVMI